MWLKRVLKQYLGGFQQGGIDHAGRTDRGGDAQKQGEVVLGQLAAHEVPVTLPDGWAGTEKLLGNYTETAAALRPYECTVLKK